PLTRHTHSFPTRRSSDLGCGEEDPGEASQLLHQRLHGESGDLLRVLAGGDRLAAAEQAHVALQVPVLVEEGPLGEEPLDGELELDRKSTRLNSSHVSISY